jgi:hypothetical protein
MFCVDGAKRKGTLNPRSCAYIPSIRMCFGEGYDRPDLNGIPKWLRGLYYQEVDFSALVGERWCICLFAFVLGFIVYIGWLIWA